jgi:hypothetical protein
MQYQKQVSISGGWVKTAELKMGERAKIVSETIPQPSSFLDKKGNPKTQDVAKVRFESQKEPVNVALNRATINALVDAFGEDSKGWQGHYLTTETEKMRVAGKAVVALYLLPEGYIKVDDENGYAIIIKKDAAVQENPNIPANAPVVEGEINVEDIPF